MMVLFDLLLGGATGLLKLLAGLPWQVWLGIGLAVAFLFVYHEGDVVGSARVQTKWDAQAAQAVVQGQKIGSAANAAAEKAIPPVTVPEQAGDAAVIPRVKPCIVRDRFDRSCAGR